MQKDPAEKVSKYQEIFATLDTEKTGRLGAEQVCRFLKEIDQDQPESSVRKTIGRFKILQFFKNTSVLEGLELNEIYKQIDNHKITFEQLLQYDEMITNKIDSELWKATASMALIILQALAKEKPSLILAPTDGPHHAKIRMQVGELDKGKHSYFRFQLEKKEAQTQAVPAFKVVLKIETSSLQQSEKIVGLWKWLFNIASQMLSSEEGGEMALGACQFIPVAHNDCFQLKVTTSNPYAQQMIKTACVFVDKHLQKQLVFKLNIDYELKFDFSKFIKDKFTDIYELFTQNYVVNLQYESNKFVSNLKNFVIKSGILYDLQYNSTDSQSILLIFLLSFQNCNLNLKFKSSDYKKQTPVITTAENIEMFLQILSSLKESMGEMEQFSEMFEQLVSCFQRKITVDAEVDCVSAKIQMQFLNLHQIFLKPFAIKTAIENQDPEIKNMLSAENRNESDDD